MPATIIPFPRQPAAAGETPHQRLVRALAVLSEAQTAQREAIAQWRTALSDLRGSAASLGQSLDAYTASLHLLSGGVGHVHAEARRLEAWADGVLTGPAATGA